MHRRQLVDYVALAVIWGASFIVLLKVVGAFGPMGAASLRSLTAAAILIVAAGLTRRRLDFRRAWRPIAVVGATTVAGQLVGLSFATPRIGTSMAAILVATIPLFSVVIGRLWRIEEVTTTGRVGLGLGFGGIVLLVGFPSVEVTPAFVLGCASWLLGSFCAAFGSNWARRYLQAVGSWEQTTGAFLVGGLLTLPLLLFVPVPAMPTLMDAAYLLVLAAVCSAFAYVLYFRLVAEVGATLAISVEFVVPVLAVVIGAVVLGERLTAPQVVGGAVIILGCAMVVGLVPRSSPRSPGPASPVPASPPPASPSPTDQADRPA